MSTNVVDCAAWEPAAAGPMPLMQSLASLDGVGYTQASVNSARSAAHRKYIETLQGLKMSPVRMGCYQKASVRQDLLNSTAYARAVMGSLNKPWRTNVTGVCNVTDCLDRGPRVEDTVRDLAQDVVTTLLGNAVPCHSGCKCTTDMSPNVCSWMQESVDSGPVLEAAAFDLVDLSVLEALYSPRDDGCSTYPSCSRGAQCVCVFTTLEPEELTSAVPQPLRPTTPPWVVFYGSAAPSDIPDTGLAGGSDWVALDACRAPEAGSRCNLAGQPTSDSCKGGSTVTEAMQSLYCGPYALFQNTNPQLSQCLSTTCLGGQTIASRRAVVPRGLKATVFSSAPITCYRLSCASDDADNGRVVVDPAQFITSTYTETLVRVALFRTVAWLDADMTVYNNSVRVFQGTTTCVDKADGCSLNSLRTRPMSYLYATSNMGIVYNNVPDQLPATYHRDLAASIIRATDDRFNSDSDIGRACLQSSPSNIALCNYSSAFGSNSLRSVAPCSDAQTSTACYNRWAMFCKSESRKPNCRCIGNGACWAWLQKCDQPSDYDNCVARFPGASACVAFFGAVCTEVVYKRTETKIPCTASPPLQCPFNANIDGQTKSWEDTYAEFGLPREGFCPACSALDGSCDVVKSSTTYAAIKDKVRMHTIAGVEVRTGSTTGANAVHLRLEADGAQCGQPACGANQKPVQYLRDLWMCVDCVAAPRDQCQGAHQCRFANGTGFAEALAGVRALVEAATPPVPIAPIPLAWGGRNNFSGFNPTTLNSGFNSAIIKLQGKCKSDQALPSFGECQNDAPRRTLRSHVQSQYTVQEGAVVPSQTTLTWPADNAQLTSTNIPAWEAARETPFLTALLDDSVCKQANFNELVCLPQSGTVRFFNPSIAGDFEIQQGCDTVVQDSTRFIDSQCNRLVCPLNTDAYDSYNMFQGSDPATNWMQCKVIDHQLPDYYSTPSSVPTNLCSKTPPTPSACAGRQGTLDGDGAPGDLYSADPPPAMPSSVLDGTLGGSKNLSLSRWDIGGHYIRMQVSGAKLSVSGLPLRAADLASAASMNATDWVKAWRKASLAERQSLSGEYSDPACGTWACPLKRWYFWTGAHKTFRPWSPSPTRTEPFYGTPTHPTTAPARLRDGVLGTYRTWDGVCAFPVGTQRPSSGPCSEAEAARALADGQQRESRAYGSCGRQADWPLVGGQLRDGATLKQNVSGCGVLDRLPNFRYRYMNSGTTIPTALTTLDEGGDCHMGRAGVATDSPPPGNCTLLEKTATSMVLECGGVNRTLTRPRSPTVEQMLQSPARSRCVGAGAYACDSNPTYTGSNGATLEAETSFGQLWRWAPARLLARDLRFRLCGNGTECPQSQSWTLETFWSNMLGNTATTATPTTPSVNAMFEEVKPDPRDPAWDQDWLLCTKNASGSMCSGKISKEEWLAGDRPSLCKAVLTQPNTKSAAVGISVCDLDDRMDSLCRAIQSARYQIFEANCKLTGKCLTSAFFYQPATYSIDDGQFVRSTVGYFYNFTEPGSCPTLDEETLKILAQNSHTAQNCAAQDLQVLQFAIQRARETVHFFVKILYYGAFIGFDIIQLVSTTSPDAIVQDIMYRFNQLTAEFSKFFQTMGDLTYKMVMETGKLGKFLQGTVETICGFLNDIFASVVVPLICFVKDAVLKVIGAFQTMISALNSFLGGALGQIDNALKSAMTEMESRLDCNMKNPFECKGLFPDNPTGPTSLPMPTRCWVGYQPSLGDQSSLGCTSADTCDDDDGLKACAACRGGGYTEAYGCDSVTKLCRYRVLLHEKPPVDRG